MTPKTKDELDELLCNAKASWTSAYTLWLQTDAYGDVHELESFGPYLRQRLADAGIQLVPVPPRSDSTDGVTRVVTGTQRAVIVGQNPFYTESSKS